MEIVSKTSAAQDYLGSKRKRLRTLFQSICVLLRTRFLRKWNELLLSTQFKSSRKSLKLRFTNLTRGICLRIQNTCKNL